jgi:hypothetical protein
MNNFFVYSKCTTGCTIKVSLIPKKKIIGISIGIGKT